MQTKYETMMAAARELVEHADDIAGSAGQVVEALKSYQAQIAEWGQELSGQFAGIRKVLDEMEGKHQRRLEGMDAHLEQVIARIRGAAEVEKSNAEA